MVYLVKLSNLITFGWMAVINSVSTDVYLHVGYYFPGKKIHYEFFLNFSHYYILKFQ